MTSPLLRITDLSVRYGQASPTLKSISLDVPEGGVTCILGSNGAGKTTLMRALSSTLFLHGGRICEGQIEFAGARIEGRHGADIVKRGLVQSPEGRRVFSGMSVADNLRAGATTTRSKATVAERMEKVFALFPRLAERRDQHAGLMSGGEQQMLAIGRALMAGPRLLLLDEPSLGLAPLVVEQIGEVTRDIAASGTTVLLVEQNAAMALGVADHAAVLELGRIVETGPAANYRDPEVISRIYLGDRAKHDEDVAVIEDRASSVPTLTRWQA